MEAIFFALISFVGWGIGDLIVAVSARRLGPFSASFWSMFFTIILFSVYTPFVLSDLTELTFSLLLLNLILGTILITGILAFREGLRIGNVALVSTIASAFTMVTTILAIIFFKEQLSVPQLIAITAIFFGIFLSMFNIDELRKKKLLLDKGVLFGIIAMFCWGIYFAFIKIPVREIGWFWPNYITFLLFPFLYVFMRLRNIPLKSPNTNNAFVPLITSTIIARIGEFSFNAGISRGYTSIVAPIAGASPVLLVILAFLFFKDPITKQQIAGIITTLLGIVLLSIFSV